MKIVRFALAIVGIVAAVTLILVIVLGVSVERDRPSNPPVTVSNDDASGNTAVPPPNPTATFLDPATELVRAVVTYVSDGDTLHATINGVDERVRLIGVDAPEIEHPGTPADCYSDDAFSYLRQ